MSLYRKDRTDSIFAASAGQSTQMVTVVPRMYVVLLAGVLLLMATVFSWSVFGSIDESTTVTGLYHPGASSAGEVVAFVPLAGGKTLRPGMEATVSLVGYQAQRVGQMRGEVTYVEEGVTGVDQMRSLLGDDTLVNVFVQNGPVVLVVVGLERDPASQNGYAWTHAAGTEIPLQDLTYASVTIVKSTVRPISLGVSGLGELLGK